MELMQTPTLEVYEDDTTVPRRKKRRSSAGRRVSFAETKTVHIFQRDDEYATPPVPSPLRRSPRLAKKFAASASPRWTRKADDSVERNSAAEDRPVDMDHLRENSSEMVVDDDITLDSTTFSTRFNEVMLQENNVKSPWTSDMSFTDQRHRRPPTPAAAPRGGVSPSASVDKCLTMQYTEVIDPGTLAQRRRRVFKGSPCAKKLKLDSPFRKPLEDITTSFLLQNDAELPPTPVPTLGALLNRDPTAFDTTDFFAIEIAAQTTDKMSCNKQQDQQDNIPVLEPSVNNESKREERRARMVVLLKENQESCDRIARMKEQLETLNRRIQQHSQAAELYKTELKRRSLLQKIQGWQSTKMNHKENRHTLDTSYSHKVCQRISIEGNEFATLELSLKLEFIEMGFPRINAGLLFQALLPQQKITIRPSSSLPAALERASSVVTNLLHVAREAVECRAEYRCLNTATFFHDSDSGACLRFVFENYRMRLKVSLTFRMQQLTSGEYPKDIVPYSVVVELQKGAKSVITEQELTKAISTLPAGYRRLRRVCECVSSFL